MVVALALLVFPKLALGLSGFETGVAVMPHINGEPDDDARSIPRVASAALDGCSPPRPLIMSVFLITSSLVTTLLIPPAEFQPGGAANGRALAYLAHAYLGSTFGTVYDASTIAIFWFAGASAMAGLLNLVPRYLPRYGMAPHWARAVRPLVLILTLGAFAITIIFRRRRRRPGRRLRHRSSGPDHLRRRRRHPRRPPGPAARLTIAFGVIALIFIYTTIANIVERPDGVKIAASSSPPSSPSRCCPDSPAPSSSESPTSTSTPWPNASSETARRRDVRFIANEPDARDRARIQRQDPPSRPRQRPPRRPRRHLRRDHRHRPVRIRQPSQGHR